MSDTAKYVRQCRRFFPQTRLHVCTHTYPHPTIFYFLYTVHLFLGFALLCCALILTYCHCWLALAALNAIVAVVVVDVVVGTGSTIVAVNVGVIVSEGYAVVWAQARSGGKRNRKKKVVLFRFYCYGFCITYTHTHAHTYVYIHTNIQDDVLTLYAVNVSFLIFISSFISFVHLFERAIFFVVTSVAVSVCVCVCVCMAECKGGVEYSASVFIPHSFIYLQKFCCWL